jgi:hypothetical protein
MYAGGSRREEADAAAPVASAHDCEDAAAPVASAYDRDDTVAPSRPHTIATAPWRSSRLRTIARSLCSQLPSILPGAVASTSARTATRVCSVTVLGRVIERDRCEGLAARRRTRRGARRVCARSRGPCARSSPRSCRTLSRRPQRERRRVCARRPCSVARSRDACVLDARGDAPPCVAVGAWPRASCARGYDGTLERRACSLVGSRPLRRSREASGRIEGRSPRCTQVVRAARRQTPRHPSRLHTIATTPWPRRDRTRSRQRRGARRVCARSRGPCARSSPRSCRALSRRPRRERRRVCAR